tara:strand:- start:4242 stop:5357 length:1116 start_codon:yes stop_codon:yes gene_type:complete
MRFEIGGLRKKQILIFDKCNSEFILNALKSADYNSFFILDLRKKSINLSILISYYFYLSLVKTKNIKLAYMAGILKKVQPEFVITFIDNNKNFYELSLQFPKIKFYAIQNGNRGLCSEKEKFYKTYYSQYFFNLPSKYYPVKYLSIGNFEKLFFSEFCSFQLKKIIPIGSLALSDKFYKSLSNNKSICLYPKFDLGIVGNAFFGPFEMRSTEKKIFLYLKKLLEEDNNLNVCYISKFSDTHQYSVEHKKYISEFFNNNIEYFDYTNNNFALANNCNLLLGALTTMLREAYSMGIKIFSTNLFPEEITTPYSNIGYNKFPSYAEFKDSIYKILNLERKKYFDLEDQKFLDLNSFEGKTASENLAIIINQDKD